MGAKLANPTRVVIIGAGPAGLSAAYELSKQDVESLVLEQSAIPGGLARTEEYKGYRFDIGGHRFFTKVALIERMWREILGDDLLVRSRLSRIYYRSKFFHYPLEPFDALLGLGIFESVACMGSFVRAQLFPAKSELTFDTWISNRFGKRLYQTFFKSYTEKVWGIPCDQISADWAAQRIRGLSVTALVKNSLKLDRWNGNGNGVVKTLIHEFHYPRLGPGMMWEKCAEQVESRNGKVLYENPVEKIHWQPGKVVAVESGGVRHTGTHFVSTMAIQDMVRAMDPKPPKEVLDAAGEFHYRDFLTVALILDCDKLFKDNWIYIHDPNVKVGRIQNFKNWSPEMLPGSSTTCLGLEYFCFEDDDLWSMPDEELIALGARELQQLGLADASLVLDGKVVRVHKAYPVYDDTYQPALETVRDFLATLPNLQTVGRNGMHRYNNQDHSMLTGILAARNIMGGNYDLWQVNVDDEYHEAGSEIGHDEIRALEAGQPLVPLKIQSKASV